MEKQVDSEIESGAKRQRLATIVDFDVFDNKDWVSEFCLWLDSLFPLCATQSSPNSSWVTAEGMAVLIGTSFSFLKSIFCNVSSAHQGVVVQVELIDSLRITIPGMLLKHCLVCVDSTLNKYAEILHKQKHVKSLVLNLYEQHNPSKVDTIESILEKYKGNESSLFANLRKKYGDDSIVKFEHIIYPAFPSDTMAFESGSVSQNLYQPTATRFSSPDILMKIQSFRHLVKTAWREVDDCCLVSLIIALEYLLAEIIDLSLKERAGPSEKLLSSDHIIKAIHKDAELHLLFEDDIAVLADAAKSFDDINRDRKDPFFDSPHKSSTILTNRAVRAVSALDLDALMLVLDYPYQSVVGFKDCGPIAADSFAAKTLVANALPKGWLQTLFGTCFSIASDVSSATARDERKKPDGNSTEESESDDGNLSDSEDDKARRERQLQKWSGGKITQLIFDHRKALAKKLWTVLIKTTILFLENSTLPSCSWIASAGKIAAVIPIDNLTLDEVFGETYLAEIMSALDWWNAGDACETEDIVRFIDLVCRAGASIEGDMDCGRTPLLDAGPQIARVLLAHGANPLYVLTNKDYPQNLKRILDWGVKICDVTVPSNATENSQLNVNWKELVQTEEGCVTIVEYLRSGEWNAVMQYDEHIHVL